MRWLDSNWESCAEDPSESGSEKSGTTAPIAKGRRVSPASECRASPIVTLPVSPALGLSLSPGRHLAPVTYNSRLCILPLKVTLSTGLPQFQPSVRSLLTSTR